MNPIAVEANGCEAVAHNTTKNSTSGNLLMRNNNKYPIVVIRPNSIGVHSDVYTIMASAECADPFLVNNQVFE